MTEQQRIIFEGACTIIAGVIQSGQVRTYSDADREAYNKYAIEKAEKMYNMVLAKVK